MKDTCLFVSALYTRIK